MSRRLIGAGERLSSSANLDGAVMRMRFGVARDLGRSNEKLNSDARSHDLTIQDNVGWNMRMPKSSGAMTGVLLLTALLSSMGVHAAVTDTKKPAQAQPVSVVADTQASARRQGVVNVGGVNWTCSGAHCSASAMSSAVAAPLAVCQALAREVGAIRSFTLANRPLNGNELQQCNSVVPAVAAAMPSMKTPQGVGLPPAAPVSGVGLLPMQAPVAPVPGAGLPPLQPPTGLAPTPAVATPAPNTSQHKDRLITSKDFTPMASPLPAEPQRVTVKPRQPTPSPYPENWIEPDMRTDKSPVFEDMRNELRKNDQPALPSAEKPSASFQLPSKSGGGFIPPVAMSPTTPKPAKKPSGANASTPPPQPPPPVETETPTAPGPRSYPVSIRTEGLTVTGTGTGMEVRLPVTSKRIRTEGLTVTGTGTGTEVRLPVTSIRIRTEGLTVTGASSAR